MATAIPNPFLFGALARDEAFTDREGELKELLADATNGQDVVIFAPRRYGKSSLIDRLAQKLVARRVLVAQVDLMKTPTKQRLAEKLAQAIYEDIASPTGRAMEKISGLFRGLRVMPTVTIDPDGGALSFSFATGRRADLDATLERLFELVAEHAAERGRRAVLILDEFQEIMEIDRDLPKMMRAVFQEQREVAHIYLGSKRHMMERIFNDANEPFWRSAKKIELGLIDPAPFATFIDERFRSTGRTIAPAVLERVLAVTAGHPYATQELCYFLWEETRPKQRADAARLEVALAKVLKSEHAHFSLVWDRASSSQKVVLQALAAEAGRPLSNDYRARHALPSLPTTQKALDALERQELVARDSGFARIVEPFLAEWIALNAT